MKKLYLVSVLLFLASCLFSQTITDRPSIAFTYDVPGAVNTYITAIAENQIVVGYYEDADGNDHGFFKSQGLLYEFDFPSAVNTYPGGIDTNNVIYGSYNTGVAQDARPFRMELTPNDPTYTDIGDLFGNITFLSVNGANNHKTFCGDYRTGSMSKLFFVDEANSMMNEQNYGLSPGLPTYAGGINDQRWVAGYYIDGVNYRGFVWKGLSDYDTIRYPGQNRTRFTGLNNTGYIIGNAGFGNQIGFVLDYTNDEFGAFEEIEIEGATAIWPQDINDNNEIVGYYLDSDGKAHGFLMLSELGIDFSPDYDGYPFVNTDPPFWDPSEYSGLTYETDPYLLNQGISAPFPMQSGGVAYPAITFPRWDYLVEAFGESNFYHEVLGQPKLIRRKMSTWLSIKENEFTGACYGMTVTAAAFTFNRTLLESRFPIFNTFPEYLWNQLEYTPQLGKAITMMQTYCWGRPFYYNRIQYKYDLAEGTVNRLLKNFFEVEDNPLCLVIDRQRGGRGCHAVFPYKIKMVDEFNYRIFVYDPNRPGNTDYSIPINRGGDFDGLATWDYYDEPFSPENQWNAVNPGGIAVSGPLETSFFQPFTFIPEEENNPISQARSDENLQLFVSSDMDFVIEAPGSTDSLGVWNNRVLDEALYGIVGRNYAFYDNRINNLFFENGEYNVDLKGIADNNYTISLSDINTNTIYFFDRTSVTNQMQEKYLVESGLTFINEENATKPLTGGLMVQTDAGETITYELNNINVAANESIEVSLVNDYMIQVNNGNENSQYDLSISYWSNSEVHEFEYSGISFSANATHIISPFAPAGDSFDPAIFVDEGQNGSNEDTLFFDNELLPNLYVEATELRVSNEGGERQALVENTGGGEINWSASTPNSWITLSQGNGINTGLITFMTNANPNILENRTGYIYVEGNGQSDTLTVVQGEFDLVGTIKVDDEISLQVYPNPASEMITISNKGEVNFRNIEIFDLTGRKMDVKIFKSPNGMAQIIVDHLSSGIYFVRITTYEKEYSVKFIKN